MIPAPFAYLRPGSVDEAVDMLVQHGDAAKLLAGGHSLIPSMKLRIAQPQVVIDLGRVDGLRYIRSAGETIEIGAMATYAELDASSVLRAQCPLFSMAVPQIADMQVRSRGTLGGSLAHADPAADWPAVILALDAELEIAGPIKRRVVKATDFFLDMFQTVVGADELLCEIRVPRTPKSVAYVKFAQKASGFAIAAAAVVIDTQQKVRVAVTGVACKPYRATLVESALRGSPLTSAAVAEAAAHATDGVEPLSDLHASAEFRAHLARVATSRALMSAMEKL